jgi:hypothetical protein
MGQFVQGVQMGPVGIIYKGRIDQVGPTGEKEKTLGTGPGGEAGQEVWIPWAPDQVWS